MANKACDHGFGTATDPAKSKNPAARDLIQKVVKLVQRLNKSSTWWAEFEDMQIEDSGMFLKIVKHAPQRWLSSNRFCGVIIRLCHQRRKLHTLKGDALPLDQGSNRDSILQLYSLMKPVVNITRGGQHGSVPMTAEMHMALSKLKALEGVPAPPRSGCRGESEGPRQRISPIPDGRPHRRRIYYPL
ncbi:unnamed protein product [Sphacelaria rigidula]